MREKFKIDVKLASNDKELLKAFMGEILRDGFKYHLAERVNNSENGMFIVVKHADAKYFWIKPSFKEIESEKFPVVSLGSIDDFGRVLVTSQWPTINEQWLPLFCLRASTPQNFPENIVSNANKFINDYKEIGRAHV